jgi:CDP-glycerol glycerophosphotransferase
VHRNGAGLADRCDIPINPPSGNYFVFGSYPDRSSPCLLSSTKRLIDVKPTPSRLRRAISRLGDVLRLITFLLLERLLPKNPNSWCFCTWDGPYPHTIDNPRGVFEEAKVDPSLIKIILLKPSHHVDESLLEGVNVFFVKIESIRGVYLLARSKIIILGYSLASLCSYGNHITTRHKIIQLWHGIPLKRIGKLFPGEQFWDTETSKYAATICSAPLDQIFMTDAFSPTPNVWITGLPRNDLISKPELRLPIDYQNLLVLLRKRISGRKFILYAPTWRESNSGLYPFSEQELDILNNFLRQENAVMGIRAHANRRPSDDLRGDELYRTIFFINEFPDVNAILRIVDVLITDYSSIYIDFLLTGRPILNFTYDIDSYVNERGFLYELDDAMPNTPFRTFDEFLIRIDAALNGRELNLLKYKKVTSLFHSHTNHSSIEVLNHIKRQSML